MNPERQPFCVNAQQPSVALPIRVNQTTPILIELLRFDFDTGENETVVIPAKQAKQLKKQADKGHTKSDVFTPRDLLFNVKKTGLYRLQKVIDDSKLEVRRRSLDTLVVACPKASIQPSADNRCKGELSNLNLEVEGTPPLKIKYSRKVNRVDHGVSFQSIQPETLRSPLTGQGYASTLVDSKNPDISWGRSQTIRVPLNESLNTGGDWAYSIEEVHDACGNIANYTASLEEDRQSAKHLAQTQRFSVHERPRISLDGCNSQSYLEVAKDDSTELPVQFHSVGRTQSSDAPYVLAYSFADSSATNEASSPRSTEQAVLKSKNHRPRIKKPGWYTIEGISSNYCDGEVFEPSSCFLHNPPEPSLAVRYEKLYDKCANNSVGLLVDLDLIGTPPFRVRYTIEHLDEIQTRVLNVNSMRSQLDLTPATAGYYKYQFLDISDRVYETRSLKNKAPLLEQDVKPPASANFVGHVSTRKACFGEPVSADVMLHGEAPWQVQYELVHNGKRTKYDLKSESNLITLTTGDLLDGGEYILGLTGVKDKSNCRRPLKEDIRIEVRPKRPQAAFGDIDRKRSTLALEDRRVELPLRLEGVAPWTVRFKKDNEPSSPVFQRTLWNQNSMVQVDRPGRYEIIEVNDATCPGSVDKYANVFEVSWISRPSISAVDDVLTKDTKSLAKQEVCEGDQDLLDVKFDGSPPYTLRYEQHCKPKTGAPSVHMKSLTAALNTAAIQMYTLKPGDCSYKFLELGDNLYNADPKRQSPLTVTQHVNPRPVARFESPNHMYGFCKEEGNADDAIPIALEGTPPFSLEVGIKHNSNSKPEVLSVPHINSNRYNLPIPRQYLDLGQHMVTIRKVRDARGCERTTEYDGSYVRVVVSDVPTIIPLESQTDYCVGERLSFSLSGQAPFDVYYTFDGVQRKATSQSTNFRRIAEKPGEFTITAVSDGASGKCKAHKNITKTIREMPSVRISKGATSVVEIHEGGEAEIIFEFWGTPPFEFT